MNTKNQKLLLLSTVIILGCSSCATIFNRSNQVVSIRSNEQTNYVFEGDTIYNQSTNDLNILVRREKRPLDLMAFNETGTKALQIKAKWTPLLGLNLFTPYLSGLLVDEISGKKFTFPKKIFVDMSDPETPYLPYFPMSPSRLKHKNQISISPFPLISDYHPGIDFGYQRLHGGKFATKFNIRYFLPRNNNYARNARGFTFEILPKYYLRNQNVTRIYAALSIEYLRKDHEAAFEFFIPDNFDDDDLTNDTFSQILPLEKRFISFTPRIGIERYLSDRWVLDAFFGIGLRYRETRIIGANPDFDLRVDDDGWFDFSYNSNRPDKRLDANFDLNFSIGWVF